MVRQTCVFVDFRSAALLLVVAFFAPNHLFARGYKEDNQKQKSLVFPLVCFNDEFGSPSDVPMLFALTFDGDICIQASLVYTNKYLKTLFKQIRKSKDLQRRGLVLNLRDEKEMSFTTFISAINRLRAAAPRDLKFVIYMRSKKLRP